MSEPLLPARALDKNLRHGQTHARSVARRGLEVARGDFLALRGASGAGKSTLLHLIGGLDSPNAGEISFDGQNSQNFPKAN